MTKKSVNVFSMHRCLLTNPHYKCEQELCRYNSVTHTRNSMDIILYYGPPFPIQEEIFGIELQELGSVVELKIGRHKSRLLKRRQ